MTDMRATERLLEVIQEQVANAERDLEGRLPPVTEAALTEILAIVIELRRRGDTLVRAADLRTILEKDDLRQVIDHHRYYGDEATDYAADIAAYDRLEIALGGKMR